MEVLEGAVRKRIWDIPSEVLCEALVNAVLHRDYTIASDVTFKIFSDRVEIANPGKLTNTLTISKLGSPKQSSAECIKSIESITI